MKHLFVKLSLAMGLLAGSFAQADAVSHYYSHLDQLLVLQQQTNAYLCAQKGLQCSEFKVICSVRGQSYSVFSAVGGNLMLDRLEAIKESSSDQKFRKEVQQMIQQTKTQIGKEISQNIRLSECQ